jgi:hypothetical protein
MKLFYGMAAVLSLLFLHACNGRFSEAKDASQAASPEVAASQTTAANATSEASYFAADSSAPPPGNQPPQTPAQKQLAPPAHIDWDKKIIKNAQLNIEVSNYKNFNELVHTAARQYGGYVAQEEQNESEYKIENTITLKVPVDQFDNAVATLTPAKEKTLVKKITSQDVTGEVVDTRSRLEAKRQVHQRYLELLKQAKNMKEILEVQSQINDIQVDLEGAAGRINYLTHAASYSTIQLTFYQVLNPQAEQKHEPGFGQRVLDALKSGLQWIGELVLLLLTLWPVLAGAAIAWWSFRKWRAGKAVRS